MINKCFISSFTTTKKFCSNLNGGAWGWTEQLKTLKTKHAEVYKLRYLFSKIAIKNKRKLKRKKALTREHSQFF